ncbi:MAG: type II toxin-antitoxin system PemK/MazF family toxin [Oscillospiraceae bacterium]|nr:type II toxin-antitoxin system PemK/MazF family toxin [Oscillospiraceae bacterium]
MADFPRNGDVWICDMGRRDGHEQNGTRPVVIVSNDRGNRHGETVVVVPLTTQAKRNLPTIISLRGEYALHRDTVALAHQITTIDKGKLIRWHGKISYMGMHNIQIGIANAIGNWEEKKK